MLTEDVTVTSKGQVTIPKEIRDRLGIEAGQELEFTVEDADTITVRPKRPAMERLRDVRDRVTAAEPDVDLDAMRRESKRAWGDDEPEA